MSCIKANNVRIPSTVIDSPVYPSQKCAREKPTWYNSCDSTGVENQMKSALRRGGRLEESHPIAAGPSARTGGPAINTRRRHGVHKSPIRAHIAPHDGIPIGVDQPCSHNLPDLPDLPHLPERASGAVDTRARRPRTRPIPCRTVALDAALRAAYRIEPAVRAKAASLEPEKGKELMETWRRLLTSDHFYYMCTKYFADGDVHKYFNPYDSPYDAHIIYMNVMADLAAVCGIREEQIA